MLRSQTKILIKPALSLFSRKLSQPVAQGASGLHMIDDIFRALPRVSMPKHQVIKTSLVQELITIEFKKALAREQKRSTQSPLFALIESLPSHLSTQEKLDLFCQRLCSYPVMPVVTSHPTRAISNEALFLLYEIIESLAKINAHSYPTSYKESLRNEVTKKIRQLIDNPLVPEKNLTQEEEAQAALYIFQRILDTFPRVYKDIVDHFVKVHGGDRRNVAHVLKNPIMESYRHIYSWVKGDQDGNHNVTFATMKRAIPTQQIALLKLYIRRMDDILALHKDSSFIFNEFLAKKERFKRCIRDIEGGVWFDVAGSNEEVASTFSVLDDLLHQCQEDSILHHRLTELRDLIELAGFYGGLKEFVRQTTHMHKRVWNNFTKILANHYPEVQDIVKDAEDRIRCYDELSKNEQRALHKLLKSNTTYFKTLHTNSQEFTAETRDELGRLWLVYKNIDIFPSYIFSDTKDDIDFEAASIAMHFSTYHFDEGSLKMRKINKYVFNAMSLCETPNDLRHSRDILVAKLENYQMRQKIAQCGFVSEVLGPSDNSKVAGIMVYGLLLRTKMLNEATLDEYKKIYPELNHVVYLWLFGFGPDFKRRFFGKYPHHCTMQGWGALDMLAAPFAFEAYLHELVGRPNSSEFLIQEISTLMQEYPETYEAWQHIEKQAMDFFASFIQQESIQKLLEWMTILEAERKMNISSRAGSKKSPKPHEARAIGVVNHYLIGGDFWDVYMSIAGLHDLPQDLKKHLPRLFEQLTVMKDIVYKVFYAIAISDNTHLWNRFEQVTPEQIQQWSSAYRVNEHNDFHVTLAHMDANKLKVLRTLVFFLPREQQAQANRYLAQAKAQQKRPHMMALELLEMLGGDFAKLAQDTRERLPLFQQFRQCVESYRQMPCSDMLANIATAGRIIQLPEEPATIGKLRPPVEEYALNHPFEEEGNRSRLTPS